MQLELFFSESQDVLCVSLNHHFQSKLHQVSINEHKKYLTRQKRKYLDEIFESWEFDLLIKNGDDMKEICGLLDVEQDNTLIVLYKRGALLESNSEDEQRLGRDNQTTRIRHNSVF